MDLPKTIPIKKAFKRKNFGDKNIKSSRVHKDSSHGGHVFILLQEARDLSRVYPRGSVDSLRPWQKLHFLLSKNVETNLNYKF